MSVSVAVNETANFTCTAIANFIEWRVNDQPVDDVDSRRRGFDDTSPPIVLNETQNLLTRTMTAFGSVENNGSVITCVGILLSPLTTAISDSAILLVLKSGIFNILIPKIFHCLLTRRTTTTSTINMHCER